MKVIHPKTKFAPNQLQLPLTVPRIQLIGTERAQAAFDELCEVFAVTSTRVRRFFDSLAGHENNT